MIHVTESLDAVLEIKAVNPPTQDITYIFAWTGWKEMSQDDFADWIYAQNENHFGVWLAAFHPEGYDASPMSAEGNVDEIFAEVDDICIILMQEYDHLVASSGAVREVRLLRQLSGGREICTPRKTGETSCVETSANAHQPSEPFDEEEGYETTH